MFRFLEQLRKNKQGLRKIRQSPDREALKL